MRTLATILTLATAVLLAQDAPKKGGGGMPHKNLKVLKDGPEIGSTMRSYVVALGAQNCGFCHVQGNFAADDNPKKETARHMIEMVNEINSKFPDGKVHVTCYTCHAGKEHPMTTPPAAAPGQ
jgi:photosynthetic reaction center cytochrome c subunit